MNSNSGDSDNKSTTNNRSNRSNREKLKTNRLPRKMTTRNALLVTTVLLATTTIAMNTQQATSSDGPTTNVSEARRATVREQGFVFSDCLDFFFVTIARLSCEVQTASVRRETNSKTHSRTVARPRRPPNSSLVGWKSLGAPVRGTQAQNRTNGLCTRHSAPYVAGRVHCLAKVTLRPT